MPSFEDMKNNRNNVTDTTDKSLTEDQFRELSSITKWLSSSKPFYVLAGSAGTGKTFLVDTIKKSIENGKCVLTATTNKAAGVLALATGEDVTTIHSALCLKLKRINHEMKLQQDADKVKNNLWGVKVVIVDEASMLNKELMEYIENDVIIFGRKYLFVGDEAQLPPVNETKSPIFDSTSYNPLTTIVRQGEGSPIITVATQIRDRINGDNTVKFTVNNTNSVGSVTRMNEEQFMKKIDESDFKDGDCKVLSWTNLSVAHYNSVINEKYGITDKPFDIGSLVLFNDAVIRDEVVIAQNSLEGRIISMEEMPPEFNENTFYYEVTIDSAKDIDGSLYKFKVIPPTEKRLFDTHFNNLKQVALSDPSKWYMYYREVENYSDIRPVFSSTVHKSQGSQWKEVFIDCNNIFANRDKLITLKMLYTAFTRGEQHLYLLWE